MVSFMKTNTVGVSVIFPRVSDSDIYCLGGEILTVDLGEKQTEASIPDCAVLLARLL